jgi:hypothetical protein
MNAYQQARARAQQQAQRRQQAEFDARQAGMGTRAKTTTVAVNKGVKELKNHIEDAGLSHADCFTKADDLRLLRARATDAVEKTTMSARMAKPGFRVNETRVDGLLPLHYSAGFGGAPCLEMLLKSPEDGVTLRTTHTYYRCGAHEHARTRTAGQLNSTRWAGSLQFDRRRDVSLSLNLADPEQSGKTPLHLAAQHGRDKCVVLLLAAGAHVDLKALNGTTPLHVAAGGGHTKCVEHLLAAGADVSVKEENGCSPLYIAAQVGSAQCVALLVAAQADVNAATPSGLTPLGIAAIAVMESTEQTGMQAAAGRDRATRADPSRCLGHLLQSRRVSLDSLEGAVAVLQPYVHQTGSPGEQQLTTYQTGSRIVLPVLEAEIRGARRWCAACLQLSPDTDLALCSGCHQVGYCPPPAKKALRMMYQHEREEVLSRQCFLVHWNQEGGHKKECKRWAAAAAAAMAEAEAAAEAAWAKAERDARWPPAQQAALDEALQMYPAAPKESWCCRVCGKTNTPTAEVCAACSRPSGRMTTKERWAKVADRVNDQSGWYEAGAKRKTKKECVRRDKELRDERREEKERIQAARARAEKAAREDAAEAKAKAVAVAVAAANAGVKVRSEVVARAEAVLAAAIASGDPVAIAAAKAPLVVAELALTAAENALEAAGGEGRHEGKERGGYEGKERGDEGKETGDGEGLGEEGEEEGGREPLAQAEETDVDQEEPPTLHPNPDAATRDFDPQHSQGDTAQDGRVSLQRRDESAARKARGSVHQLLIHLRNARLAEGKEGKKGREGKEDDGKCDVGGDAGGGEGAGGGGTPSPPGWGAGGPRRKKKSGKKTGEGKRRLFTKPHVNY